MTIDYSVLVQHANIGETASLKEDTNYYLSNTLKGVICQIRIITVTRDVFVQRDIVIHREAPRDPNYIAMRSDDTFYSGMHLFSLQ